MEQQGEWSNKMSKVWLVTEGDYSDYTVLAAYTTKALAKSAAESYNARGAFGARVHGLPLMENATLYTVWVARIASDGTIDPPQGTNSVLVPEATNHQTAAVGSHQYKNMHQFGWVTGTDLGSVSAVAEKMSRKARERLANLKAKGTLA
jgi:hypothetical protein